MLWMSRSLRDIPKWRSSILHFHTIWHSSSSIELVLKPFIRGVNRYCILKAMIACKERLKYPNIAYSWFWDIAPLTKQSSLKFILCRVYVGFIELWSVNYSLSYQQYNSYQQGCNKQVFPPYINHNLTTFIFCKKANFAI